MAGNSDVDLETDALYQFAQPDYGPELNGISGAENSGGKGGNLDGSKAFFQVEAIARSQLVSFMTQVSVGTDGYRSAVSRIATIYHETDNRAFNTMRSVLPFATKAPTS